MEIKLNLARGHEPSAEPDMRQRYVRAERLLAANAAKLTSDLVIDPNWIGESDRFWYRWKSLTGVEFVLVDPATGERSQAFDHSRLAAALSQATGTPCAAARLPFDEIEFLDEGGSIVFEIDHDGKGERWSIDLESYSCTRIGESPKGARDVLRSPDDQWEAFTRDHNIWARSVASGEERAITTDGTEKNDYGEHLLSPLTTGGIDHPPPPFIKWSPDSGKLLFCRVDQREAPQFHLVQSVPKDGGIRPVLHSFAYPLPGDEVLPLAYLHCADLTSGAVTALDTDPIEIQYHGPPVYGDGLCWSADSETIYFLRQGRGYFRIDLSIIDAETGAARIAISEESSTGIDPSVWRGTSNVRAFADGSRVIWYSQRDGWGHLYLYDAENGSLIRQLTAGDCEVSNVEHVDEAAGLVYFTAMGREANRDPYYGHLYRVSLEGGEPELLTPEDADHTITFSPAGCCFIDSYSTVDQAPVILLRAADGSTTAAFTDAARERDKNFWEAQSLAELGFLVVMIDGLGMPGRSKAQHDHSYRNLPDNGLPDHIAAMRQLADRYDYLDISRVGIFGHSAGGYASCRAMFAYPDFFKVAVSSAGNHDHRLDKATWVERYMGLPVGEHYVFSANQNHAENLKGKLLLIHGDMDENVHVASTMVVVDELIKANKDFDLLIMPNQPHSCTAHPYFVRRRWDYFVQHLLGVDPPAGYQIQ